MQTSLRKLVPTICGLAGVAAVLLQLGRPLWADDTSPPNPRRTDTVALIERCLPSVVSILAEVDDGKGGRDRRIGSGTIIHPAGFILTSEHIIRGFREGVVLLPNGTPLPMRVNAAFTHDDLALIQVKTDRPLPAITLGRSHDVQLGEPTLVIGSPGGLSHSVSTGIISGVNRSTRNEWNFLPWMIQTNAAVSRGNSGGPLLNALGEQIGVIATIGNELQNVSFAIAIDHIRNVLPQMLSIEQRLGLWFGIECDPLAQSAIVSTVAPGSPAEKAGLQIGDVVRRMGEFDVYMPFDVHLALISRGVGDVFKINVDRAGQPVDLQIELTPITLAKPIEKNDKQPGLQFAVYKGEWKALPDFKNLTPERTGRCNDVNPAAINAPTEHVGLTYNGYVEVPNDDLYAFYVTSDDGSRLWIGDRLVVDNDGTHPAREAGGLIRLRAGLHPFRLHYFENTGAEALSVAWESNHVKKAPIPASVFFFDAPSEQSPSPEEEAPDSTGEADAAAPKAAPPAAP